MDDIDLKILKLLSRNSRISASEISKELHMSVPAIIERIHKLESDGTIKKYTLQVDYEKFNKELMAYIFVGFNSSELDRDIRSFIEKEKEIVECSFITGDYDYILRVITENSKSLTKLIHKLKNFSKVSKTRTIIILENIKDEKDIIF